MKKTDKSLAKKDPNIKPGFSRTEKSALIKEIHDMLCNFDYVSVNIFKESTERVAAAFLRGRGLPVDPFGELLSQLIQFARRSKSAEAAWFSAWVKKVHQADSERLLTRERSGHLEDLAKQIFKKLTIEIDGESVEVRDDNDGVYNHLDECPSTSAGDAVDEDGCSDSQKDTDYDGFADDVDDCPTTAGASNKDLFGCPDADGDGWSNFVDEFPDDPDEWLDSDGDGRCGVAADLNNDGMNEIIVRQVGGGALKIYENRFPRKNYLKVSLRGTKSNSFGIGARLTLSAASQTQVREMYPVNSYRSQAPNIAHFGLNEAKEVDLLEVKWPSGRIQRFRSIEVNRHIIVEENKETLSLVHPQQLTEL